VSIAAEAEIEKLISTLARIKNDKLDKIIAALKVSASN